jgi:hypothetical protein
MTRRVLARSGHRRQPIPGGHLRLPGNDAACGWLTAARAAGVDETTYRPPRRLGKKRLSDRHVDRLELCVRKYADMRSVKSSHVDDSIDACYRCPANTWLAKIADNGRPLPGHPVNTSNELTRDLGRRSNGSTEST